MKSEIILFLLVFISLVGCKDKQPPASCQCPIPIPQDTTVIREKGKNQSGFHLETDDSAVVPIYSKIKASIQIAGGYSQSDTFLREVYSGMLPANPGITQKAALFRGVACAFYKIICEDTTLSQTEKNQKMESVVQNYEQNLKEILNWTNDQSAKGKVIGKANKGFTPPVRKEEPEPITIPVLIIFNKELLPRIFWNNEQMICRDTFLPGRERAWLCNVRQYPGKPNQIKIQDRNGVVRCSETIGQLNSKYQRVYPCL
jgi:hypothetical protein